MLRLETPRLLLLSTPLQVIQTRLLRANFTADVPSTPGGGTGNETETVRVHFPSEWPGDALAIFPSLAEEMATDPGRGDWGGTMIERATRKAVGQMSFMEPPEASGMVELGYGVNPSSQNRGYATETARALVTWAAARSDVRRITAKCRKDNLPSLRVLEKVGFRRTGRWIEQDEEIIVWEWESGSCAGGL